MAHPKVHFVLAGLLAAGVVGCTTYDDGRPSSATDPQPASQSRTAGVQSQSQMIEGQVIRNEGDAYIIKEPSGQQTRILLDKNTVRENIAVGDYVVVRYDSAGTYASTVMRRSGNMPALSAASTPRPQTVEGVVQRQEGNEYVVKDISGKEMRLRVDNMTQRDGNITAGDRVMAIVSALPSDASRATTVYSIQNPYVFQGEVVGIDGNWYVVRDSMGKEVRVRTDNMTRRDGTVTAGDRVVMFTNTMPSDFPYATTVYRYPSSNIIQGEVVRIDGNCYAVRDSSGRDICLYSNSSTVWNDRVVIGDRVIAYIDPTASVHVDSIAKR